MKTKFRNKLDNESINGLLRLKQLKNFDRKEVLEGMVKKYKNN